MVTHRRASSARPKQLMVLLVALLLQACAADGSSPTRRGSNPDAGGTRGSPSPTAGGSSSAGGDETGAAAGEPAGGEGHASHGGGSAGGPMGTGGDVDEGSGGQTGGAASGAGGLAAGAGGSGGTSDSGVLNGCGSFADATSAGEARVIAWDVMIGVDPGRCLKIEKGQAVTWVGPLESHPLQPAGGTTPSPILADYPPEASSHTITFPSVGLYGYVCGSHAAMQGAVLVIE